MIDQVVWRYRSVFNPLFEIMKVRNIQQIGFPRNAWSCTEVAKKR